MRLVVELARAWLATWRELSQHGPMGPECHGPRVPAVSGSVLLFCDATHPQAESHPRSLFPKDSPINGPRNRNTRSVADLLLALCWRRADGCVGHTSVHGLIVTPVLGGLECVRVRSVCARVVLNSSSSTHCGTTSCCAGGHGSTQAAAEAVPANGCPGRVARLTDAPHEERSLIGF